MKSARLFYFMEKREYLNTTEAANFIGRSDGALRNLVMRRAIPFRKPGGRLIFLKSELRAWIENSPGMRLEELNGKKI